MRSYVSVDVLPGAEITHAPPELIPELIKEARHLGAKIVVVHGENHRRAGPERDKQGSHRVRS